MQAANENNLIIDEINQLIDTMKIGEIEDKLIEVINNMHDEWQENREIIDERNVYSFMERSICFFNRIIAVNESVIEKNELLANRIQQVKYLQSIPISINLMDMPINYTIYSVQLYYRKLYDKYSNQPTKFMLIGLMGNVNGRELRSESLSENERKIAQILNVFMRCIQTKNILYSLIDLCKNINFNYYALSENILDDNDE